MPCASSSFGGSWFSGTAESAEVESSIPAITAKYFSVDLPIAKDYYMNCEAFEQFFSNGARSAGSRLYNEGKVFFSQPSGLEILSYVKPNFKVSLKLESIQSQNIDVDCNCSSSKKGQLCKHIWATFLAVLKKDPHLFESVNKVSTKSPEINSNTAFNSKQEDYRKLQYQKQKARAKEFKIHKKKSSKVMSVYPDAVQAALIYFSKNGFSFENSLDEASVFLARKKLSRIFHPDVGGSHAETLELNYNSEVILKYISKH